MTVSQKVKAVLVYLKSALQSAEIDGQFEKITLFVLYTFQDEVLD
jgi:hypothetical protein